MSFLTVLTPTYNRAKTLGFLYESLCKQSLQNFEWIVVDDGSSDGTKDLVLDFKKKSLFVITYIYKENGGKHTALNLGIKQSNSELTIIVDSDDSLLENAVKDIYELYLKYSHHDNIAAFSFLRCFKDGRHIVGLDKPEFVANYIDYRIKGNKPGDMAEVFKTHVLKNFLFPEFENENFISEDIVWIEISKKYDYVFINKSIYECEYLDGGLTSNDKLMKFSSPLGSMLRGYQLMYTRCGLIANIKGAIIYNCYYKKNSSDYFSRMSLWQKLLIILTKPVGIYFKKKWIGTFAKR